MKRRYPFIAAISLLCTILFVTAYSAGAEELKISGLTLTGDQTIQGYVTFDGPVDLAGHKLTVTGSVIFKKAPCVLTDQ